MNFCFKWFLIVFKREFSYDDTKILWEVSQLIVLSDFRGRVVY